MKDIKSLVEELVEDILRKPVPAFGPERTARTRELEQFLDSRLDIEELNNLKEEIKEELKKEFESRMGYLEELVKDGD